MPTHPAGRAVNAIVPQARLDVRRVRRRERWTELGGPTASREHALLSSATCAGLFGSHRRRVPLSEPLPLRRDFELSEDVFDLGRPELVGHPRQVGSF